MTDQANNKDQAKKEDIHTTSSEAQQESAEDLLTLDSDDELEELVDSITSKEQTITK